MQRTLFTVWTGSGFVAGRLKSSLPRVTERHQIRWRQRRGILRADRLDTTTTIGTAGAGVRVVAATSGTDHAAPLMIAIAGDRRVLENLVDRCMAEEEAGVVRMRDTGRGLEESPERDLAPNLHLHERTPTLHRLPITPRKKCDGPTPQPAPSPAQLQDHALVPGPDPGPDVSQEDARKVPPPPFIRRYVRCTRVGSFVKCLFWHECNVRWTICRKLVFAAPF